MTGIISPVFWMADGRYGFQYADGRFRLYGPTGEFICEFLTFTGMVLYIGKNP